MYFEATENKSYENGYPLRSTSNNRDMFPNPQGESSATIYQSKDEESDKSILGDRENTTIKQTREVNITYSSR